jgi:hypothetical protein
MQERETEVDRSMWDAVSLSILVYWLAPAAAFVSTRRPVYLALQACVIGCELIVRGLHALPVVHPLMARPAHACDCNIFNGGGACGIKNGMPSGHVTITAFVLFGLLSTMAAPEPGRARVAAALLWGVAAALVALMGASRYARGCHTAWQVLAGAALGAAMAYAFSAFKAPSPSMHEWVRLGSSKTTM